MLLSDSNGSLIYKTNGGKLGALVHARQESAEHTDADSRTLAKADVFFSLVVVHVQVPPV